MNKAEPQIVFYKARFALEDWFGPFDGWTTDKRWNGWACPYFEFDTAMRMVDVWNQLAFDDCEAYMAQYDENRDEFCFADGGFEEWDRYSPRTIEAEGRRIKVYPIGAYCWTWEDWDGAA